MWPFWLDVVTYVAVISKKETESRDCVVPMGFEFKLSSKPRHNDIPGVDCDPNRRCASPTRPEKTRFVFNKPRRLK